MENNTLLDQNLEDESELEYEYATAGQRLANYFVDLIVINILSTVGGVVMAVVLSPISEDDRRLRMTSLVVSFFISLAYYTFMESSFNGRTLGKMVTGTRALCIDGTPMDFNKTLIRSLCRFIPFDQLSFLGSIGSGWHDTVSKTMVVKDTD